jgi:very-short-patch-repair endonuclease
MSKKEIKLEDSFAQHPKAKYWSDMNGDIKPKDIYKGSKEKFWFNCDKCEHIFEKQISLITRLNGWCPYCPNKKLCGNDDCKDCYNKTFATHEKAKFWSNMNGNIKPKDIARCTHTKYWFNCDCGHEIYLAIDKITLDDNWCSYCSSSPKLLCDKDCEKCFNKSFVSHEKSKYWSPKNNIIPRQVFLNTPTKFWFNCNKCTHEFDMRISDITNNEQWCPYCSNKALCTNEKCIDCYNKSFASYEKSKYWSDKNSVKPRDVFKGTAKKYFFNCDKCCHCFESYLGSITAKKPSWCPYCASLLFCKNQDCTDCLKNSFASNEKSKFWSNKNGDIKPYHVSKSTASKYWFNCKLCNIEYLISLDSISRTISSGCPNCMNKTEKFLMEKIMQIYPNIEQQFRVKWCRKEKPLPFDFVLKKEKIIIELDGGQHFKQVMNWKSPEDTQIIDKYKMECANKNGYSVIRLLQEDVYGNKYDWIKELDNNIKKIIKEDKIQNIYICKKNEYDVYF